MRILDAKFLGSFISAATGEGLSIAEFLVIGRSNVGKSSLINSLVSRKIARTSSTPGATRTINRYSVRYEAKGGRRELVLSDFPGFGYSRVSKGTYSAWERIIDGYMAGARAIRGVLWVYDVRRDFDDLDGMVYDWLREINLPVAMVLTKADKEGRSRAEAKRRKVSTLLPAVPVFLYSSKDGSGRRELLLYLFRGADGAPEKQGATASGL